MSENETPEERKQRVLDNLAKARAVAKANKEARKLAEEQGETLPAPVKKRPRNLDRIVRDILDDETLVDKVIQNQPEYWNKLPAKNGGYILATVMMVKAMGGDIKAAEWIRKTGFGDKVLLETDNGFFARDQFTIQVVPAKELGTGITSTEVLESEIKQVEDVS